MCGVEGKGPCFILVVEPLVQPVEHTVFHWNIVGDPLSKDVFHCLCSVLRYIRMYFLEHVFSAYKIETTLMFQLALTSLTIFILFPTHFSRQYTSF